MKSLQKVGDYSAVLEDSGDPSDSNVRVSIILPGNLFPTETFLAVDRESAELVLPAYVDVNVTMRPDDWITDYSQRADSGDVEAARELMAYMASRAVLAESQDNQDALEVLSNGIAAAMSSVAVSIIALKIDLIEQGILPSNASIREKVINIEQMAGQIAVVFDLIDQMRGDDDSGEAVH